jgi:putative NADH-flavin reductase
MNVVLYGATGKSGIRILTELLSRNHNVTAVARNPTGLPANSKTVKDDLSDVNKIASIIAGSEAVVSAYAPPQDDTDQLLGVTEREIEAVRKAGKNIRLIVVGGAGSLEVAPGVTVLKSGHLPAEWVPIATSHEKALELLKQSDINWTYFSPAAFFAPGTRTGKFRLDTNKLVANAQGDSRISMEDYAIALVDELEKPAHQRAQFTIGY